MNKAPLMLALVLAFVGRTASAQEAEANDLGGWDLGPVAEDLGAVDAGASASPAPDAGKDDTPDWTPKISATVKPVQVKLGDPITVEIKVRHRTGVSVNLPLKLELGKFSELSRAETAKQLGSKGEMPEVEALFTLKVAAYELGELTLPEVEVTALGPRGELITLTTAEVPIKIVSVMSNEPQPKLKALEPPVSVFQRTWWLIYLLIGLAAAGLVATATLLINRHLRARRKQEPPPPPPVPPHVIALERLDALDLEGLIAQERFKELYLELSEIVRGYTGGRWGFDALEMTTFEIGEALRRAGVVPELSLRFEAYYNDCDLVKFAKYVPEAEAAREAEAEARSIVEETRGGEAKSIKQKAKSEDASTPERLDGSGAASPKEDE